MHARIHDFDLALSFAGEDRPTAQKLALLLKRKGIRVFYDEDAQGDLLGETLTEYLIDLYKNRATYCAVLVSKHYVAKRWTRHEWKAAQARAFEEIDEPYILPVRLDDIELPGLLPTIGYISLTGSTHAKVASLIAQKVRSDAKINRLLRTASQAFEQGKFKKAITQLKELPQSRLLKSYTASRLLIDARMMVGEFSKARALLLKLLELGGENAENQFLCGVCCYQLKRFDEAVSHYKRALKLAPTHLTAKEDLLRAKERLREAKGKDSTPVKRRERG